MYDMIKHNDLQAIGAKWLNKKAPNIYHRCQYVVEDFMCMGTVERPDILGLRGNHSVLIEVKVSRSDFKADQNKYSKRCGYATLGSRRFYLVPKGLVQLEEVPNGWGLLEWDGKKIEMTRDSISFMENQSMLCNIMYSIIRRQNKAQVFNFKKDRSNND